MAKRIKKHTQDESVLELSSTEISPRVARIMSWTFVALICFVPLLQLTVETTRAQRPQVLNLFVPFWASVRQAAGGHLAEAAIAMRPSLTREFLRGFEDELERASVTKSYVQPRMQTLLTGLFGFGNEKGVVGRNGWLFYQPGIDYLAGPDFIEKSHLEALAKKMVDKQRIAEPYPDPRPAILGLNRDLGKYGIRLVVLPAPEKAALQLAQLTRRSFLQQSAVPPSNRGYRRFAAELQKSGVDVLDPMPKTIGSGEVRFLAQDTHWTPEFMDVIAGRLATHIANLISLSPNTVTYRLEDESVTRVGDLVDMLNLTKNQRLYLPETVRIRKVIDTRTQKPFEPDPGAEILLLGDSYANIYSQPDMGWGRSAGLAEHLAYHLQRPVDVIAFNGGGTSRTRGELARRENEERLGRKKVVVYEFAVRDLLGENWKPIPVAVPKLPQVPVTTLQTSVATLVTKHSVPLTSAELTPRRNGLPKVSAASAEVPAKEPTQSVSENEPLKTEKNDTAATTLDPALIVIGRVVKTSNVPRPGTAPYKDCLSFVKVRVEKIESGSYDDSELVVVFWAMKDNAWLPAASYSVGDRLRMTLIPLKKADRQIRSMQRADDLDDFVHQPYYSMQETRP